MSAEIKIAITSSAFILIRVLCSNRHYNNIPNVISQVDLGRVVCTQTLPLPWEVETRESVSDRPLAQGKAYQSRY
uniref:Uncharacterized protein n=1 Tax=Solanum tuberosum TaxID=4113 RepID=M1C6G5_SOLTU